MKIIIRLLLILLFQITIQSQPRELFVKNNSNVDIGIKIYPVGCIFNGAKEYSFESSLQIPNYDFITGYEFFEPPIEPGFRKSFEHDADGGGIDDPPVDLDGIIGYGKYRIDFFEKISSNPNVFEYKNYCYVDYSHSLYPWSPPPNGLTNDIYVGYEGAGIILGWPDEIPLPPDRTLRIWDQRTPNNPNAYEPQNKSGFHTTNSGTNFEWLNFPLIANEYEGPTQETPGKCFVNLDILSTHDAKLKCGTTFEFADAVMLVGTTNGGANYFVGDQTNNTNCSADYLNKASSAIILRANSQFIVEKGSRLLLEKNSRVTFHTNTKILLKDGSYFCNLGAILAGSISIQVQGNVKKFCASPPPTSADMSDSINFKIDSGAVFEIPDSTEYIFNGSESILKCDFNSEIKFGKGSKLIFQDGARINANGCRFVSYDSTEVWDGIYLDGIAYDTLKNCTFQNAVNGINITDNYNPFGSPGAVEISNCTFKNSTSSDLLNYVYVNNSYNVLIKGCTSEKTGSGGFTSGIIAEYCPTNGVIIADNNINYVTTGISLLQSSEYIGRNTITGSTNTGTGIYLDNSNGTIEYNTVNNFQKSVYGSYSSPYMLKNTLSNAYVKNIDLASNSYPVMKPVVSGSTLRWLGGNNTISGTPSNSGIAFADCYPLMDSGYNKITVNGSDYMNGNFTFSYTTVNAKINYWYDNPPQSSLFDISGGNVNYADPFDGSTLPSTDGTELNSIGWGLYDTLFTKSFGDNSTPEDLFMQAYTEEMSQNYTDAITHYKEVVSSYKSSSFAPVSLSRIFNCLEKSHASSSDYQTIQTYYNSIKSNSVYPNESRELAEDFVIKSKVKLGNVEEATNDYYTIYQANQNNSKGLHALLNKYCLENMIQGDNSSGNTNYQDHKMNILSLITGENIRSSSFTNNNTPKQFRLLQNYPNPFNPVTNIRYEIPKDVNVSIKIYDILGREVFSFNEYKLAGSYEVQFDGSNFASGMYFYKLETDGFTDTKKMVLLK